MDPNERTCSVISKILVSFKLQVCSQSYRRFKFSIFDAIFVNDISYSLLEKYMENLKFINLFLLCIF